MKILISILMASLVSLTAFSQGKIGFFNDSLHLCYYPVFFGGLSGQAVDSGHMPSGITLVADLYIGTSSSALSLITSTTFSSSPGKWNQVDVMVPGIVGGTSVFVVAAVQDSAFAPLATWTPDTVPFTYGIWGSSVEFPFVLGSGVTYPSMYSQGTWPVGTFPMDQYGAGSRGAIPVGIPEPSVLALVGLGTGIMSNRGKRRIRRI